MFMNPSCSFNQKHTNVCIISYPYIQFHIQVSHLIWLTIYLIFGLALYGLLIDNISTKSSMQVIICLGLYIIHG